MSSINKATLLGHLGADVEMRYMPNGDPVATLRVATSETWKDKQSGERREATEWHRVIFFRGLADVAGKYLKKGSRIHLEGKITTRKWQNKDGQDCYTTEIIGSDLLMLDRKPDDNGQGKPNVPQPQPGRTDQAPQKTGEPNDIPF